MRRHSAPSAPRPQAQTNDPSPAGAASGDYVDAAFIARHFGVSCQTVRNWAEAGAMPRPVRIPGTRYARWKRSVVLAWIAEQEAKASREAGHAV